MKIFKEIDIPYFLTFLFLIGSGIVAIYSSSTYISYSLTRDHSFFFNRHMKGLFIGIFVFIFFVRINMDLVLKHYKKAWFLSFILLILPFFPVIGVKLYGSHRWVRLIFFQFQPSEVVKYLIIIYISGLLYQKKDILTNFKKGVLPLIMSCFVLVLLIILEPDISTSFIMLLVVFILFFLSGVSILHLLSVLSLGIPLFLFLLSTKGYLFRRFAFLNPFDDPYGSGYHLIQSFIAFKKGGVLGKGAGTSTQKISNLPEAHTDFIYSIIIEEVGAIGGFILILSFIFLLYRGFKIARDQMDVRKQLIVYGFSSLIVVEQCMHLFVVMGIVPTTGLPLPFISYGRTAVIISIAMVATILNISRDNNKNNKDKTQYGNK